MDRCWHCSCWYCSLCGISGSRLKKKLFGRKWSRNSPRTIGGRGKGATAKNSLFQRPSRTQSKTLSNWNRIWVRPLKLEEVGRNRWGLRRQRLRWLLSDNSPLLAWWNYSWSEVRRSSQKKKKRVQSWTEWSSTLFNFSVFYWHQLLTLPFAKWEISNPLDSHAKTHEKQLIWWLFSFPLRI